MWEPPCGGSGRSALVETDTLQIFCTVGKAFEGEKQSVGTVLGEDVGTKTIGVVGEVGVSEEALFTFGAFQRVVGDVR